MKIVEVLVGVGVIVMMFAQMRDVVMNVLMMFVGILAVGRRRRMGDSFVDGVVVTLNVIVTQVDVMSVMVSEVVAVVVSVM